MKRLALLTLVLAAVPAVPAPAATVALDGDTLRFTAGARESNHPTFHHRAEGELVVYDPGFPGRPVTAGAGCAQDGDNTVICPRGAVARAEFSLGGSPRGETPDSLTLTAAVPIPVAVSAVSTSGARVSYIDVRPIVVSLDGAANDGPAGRGDTLGPGIDNVSTGDGTDTIVGNQRANSLNGDNGADEMRGAAGPDTITAASFNDVGADAVGLESRGADTVSCGPGADTVYYDASDTVAADCERRVLVFDAGFAFRGTSRADRIVADRGPAVVNGFGGNDRLGATRDIGGVSLFGDRGNDRLAGNVDADNLQGGTGDDFVTGAAGDDRIDGGRGRDRLSGGSGVDRILARDRSRDAITCGPGRDTVTADRIDRVARDCERVSRR